MRDRSAITLGRLRPRGGYARTTQPVERGHVMVKKLLVLVVLVALGALVAKKVRDSASA